MHQALPQKELSNLQPDPQGIAAPQATFKPEQANRDGKYPAYDSSFSAFSMAIVFRRNGHEVERPGRFYRPVPFVLEADLQGQEAGRETTDVEGDSGIDLPNGR